MEPFLTVKFQTNEILSAPMTKNIRVAVDTFQSINIAISASPLASGWKQYSTSEKQWALEHDPEKCEAVFRIML